MALTETPLLHGRLATQVGRPRRRRRRRIRGRSHSQATGVVSLAIFPRLSTRGRRRSGVVRCDAGVETRVQAVAKAIFECFLLRN